MTKLFLGIKGKIYLSQNKVKSNHLLNFKQRAHFRLNST